MIPTSSRNPRSNPRRPERTCRFLRRGGFTLIELLVVVGIIALLLSIMLPSMLAARREAKRVVCQANLKQVVLGWRGYLDDSKGWFPPHITMGDINYGGRQGILEKYQGRKPINKHLGLPLIAKTGAEVFCCPSDNGGGTDSDGSGYSAVLSPYFRYYGTSYWTNPLLAGAAPFPFAAGDPCSSLLNTSFDGSSVKGGILNMNVAQLDQESRLFLVADAGWYKAWTYKPSQSVVDWHRGGRRYNVGFMDGHADFVEIRRGIYTTAKYTIMPTSRLQKESVVCQSSK